VIAGRARAIHDQTIQDQTIQDQTIQDQTIQDQRRRAGRLLGGFGFGLSLR
jgi:hypothetical protein